ncbi:2OG-Fe(II) oxygenase [Spirosoma sp. HMF4905]|uniref:2OG-Fe(II) oxygenase n=1 Tax=Spirosoma arboris TaxID=2682092 RepID=A0A7K1S663_9BACT|nr:2OG-Fe(II) oxygenase [Spirosoma arboris]MVM29309.1 2OG-Fe(II) oxygenase [Spirosoma arboris]
MESVLQSLVTHQKVYSPFEYLIIKDIFSHSIYDELVNLPVTPPERYNAEGKRNSNNNHIFFNEMNCKKFDVCRKIAATFQSRNITSSLETMLGVNLKGSYLRIGYYVDKDGFWLLPHTDLSVKLITITVYLSKDKPFEDLGTDLFDSEKKLVCTTSSACNSGFIFRPANNTWHGFNKKNITGLRRTLVINYVSEDWLSREELCSPQINY